jgi:hypothetical protein
VTRNTTASVDAFFGLVGEEWRSLFSEIRTREFKYVKPDKRLLLELAEVGVLVQVAGGVRLGALVVVAAST